MSENITIQEGGRNRAFGPVEKIRTATQDGKTQLWVPRSSVPLGEKSVYRNGTYNPSDDEKYGYSRFEVDVSDSGAATGHGNDGKDYTWSVDNLGNLVEEKAPTRIVIDPPPSFVGRYHDGDAMRYDGMVVKAYDEDGLWTHSMYPNGIIPMNELILEDIFSPAFISDEMEAYNENVSNLYNENAPQPIHYTKGISYACTPYNKYTENNYWTTGDAVIVVAENNDKTGMTKNFVIALSPTGNGKLYRVETTFSDDLIEEDQRKTREYELNAFTTATGETGYVHLVAPNDGEWEYYSGPEIYDALGDYDGKTNKMIPDMWEILYGTGSQPVDAGGVPVKWPRYSDGKILTAYFHVTYSITNAGQYTPPGFGGGGAD